jgi:hypothetical protein
MKRWPGRAYCRFQAEKQYTRAWYLFYRRWCGYSYFDSPNALALSEYCDYKAIKILAKTPVRVSKVRYQESAFRYQNAVEHKWWTNAHLPISIQDQLDSWEEMVYDELMQACYWDGWEEWE